MGILITKETGPAEIILKVEQTGIENADRAALFNYAAALREAGRRKDSLRALELLAGTGFPPSKKARVRWSLEIGQTFDAMKRFSEAENAFRRSCELDPGSTVPWVFLGGTLARQEKFEEAIAVLEPAVDLPGDPDEVLLNIGFSLRTLGRLDEAAAKFRKALELCPDYPGAASALHEVECALRARDTDNKPTAAMLGRDITAETGAAEVILKVERAGMATVSPKVIFDYADALRMVGRSRDALQAFQLLQRRGIPGRHEWRVLMFWGRTYLDMGRIDEAEKALRRSCKLSPGAGDKWATEPWVLLAAAFSAQERFAEAVVVLEQAIDLPGEPHVVFKNIGLCLRAMGRLDEATDPLRKAVGLAPDDAQAAEALRDVERALAFVPSQ